jgi:broad specificity phosphatase PhoE
MKRLVLIRHTEVEESMRDRIYGRLDPVLSPAGRAHAETLATALAALSVEAIVSSPSGRSLETAAPLARRLGLEVTIHPGLREIDFGEWEGLTFEEVAQRDPEGYRIWMTRPPRTRFPGGEDYSELKTRVLAAVSEIRAKVSGAAIVAHGGVNRVILADALGLADDDIFRVDQPLGAVSVIDWIEDVPVVRALNAAVESAAWLARSS